MTQIRCATGASASGKCRTIFQFSTGARASGTQARKSLNVSFLYTSLLTLGLPLLAAPLVIHLINLRRHRRIEWGAMQFLLESQKRNRKWIVLKQILLLLMRTAAVGLAVLMLAGPVIRSGWASLFGSGVTHHLILLDDSYSMADHWDETTALDEAKRVVVRVLDQARGRSDQQLVTLMRFSEAKNLAAGSTSEFDRRPLDNESLTNLEPFLTKLEPSESNAGPVEALQAAARLPEPTAGETRIAYLISDFRRPQWNEQAQVRQLVSRLRERTSKLLLVQSAYDERPNLAITHLAPESGIRAAGVEAWMELSVANYGDQTANNVTVSIEQDGAKLPAVVVDEIPAGEQAMRRFRVTFPTAGSHQLEARLEGDAVATDNVRYFAAEIPAAFPVLVIDGSPEGDDGFYLRNALSPGGRNLAGWTPQVEPASFLRQHEKLGDYAVICLLDVARLDDPEVAALEDYVKGGGGLALFLGPEAVRSFYNDRLYHDGQGFLPAPLDVPAQLLRDARVAESDLKVADHPVFRVFAGERNSFLSVAKVDFYYGIDPLWQPPTSGDVRTIARLRNGAPLFMEKKLGAGRVVVGLCKLSPKPTEQGAWSNLSLNPVFPVVANELVGYLSATRRRYDMRGVDEPVSLSVDEAPYLPEVRVRSPSASDRDAAAVVPEAHDGRYIVNAPGAPHSGVWEFQLTTREGKPETRMLAVNVPTGEGDLHLLPRAELEQRLRGIDYEFALASQFSNSAEQLEGSRLADAMLYALLAALACEQLLAYSASYHPAAAKRAA